MLVACDIVLNQRVKNASLSLESGKLLVLLGPNGAGKSTLLSILAGLQRPDAGCILLDEKPLTDFSVGELAKRRSVLEQRPILPLGFKVRAILEMGIYRHGKFSVIDEAVSLMGIAQLMDKDSKVLSGGEAQRVLLARSLIQLLSADVDQQYLLLDEPTTSLDIGAAEMIMSTIKHLAHDLGIGVLVVLHDVNLALRYADKVGLMAYGKLEVLGNTAEVMHIEKLQELYQTALVQLMDNATPPHKAFIAFNQEGSF